MIKTKIEESTAIKIGKTNHISSRFFKRDYVNGILINIASVKSYNEAEKELIKKFNETFNKSNTSSRESFIVNNISVARKIFNEVSEKYNINFEELKNIPTIYEAEKKENEGKNKFCDFSKDDKYIKFLENNKLGFIYNDKNSYRKTAINLNKNKFDDFKVSKIRFHDDKYYILKESGRYHGWYYIGKKINQPLLQQLKNEWNESEKNIIRHTKQQNGNHYYELI